MHVNPENPVQTIESLRALLRSNVPDFDLSGKFSLTKTGPRDLSFRIKRELAVEQKGRRRLSEVVEWSELLARFMKLHPDVVVNGSYVPDTFAISLNACSTR